MQADWAPGPWAQLVWLVFLLIPLRLDAPLPWLATAAAAAVFVALHFWGYAATGPVLWVSRTLIFGLGVALFPWNGFSHTFFMYAGMPGVRATVRESAILIGLTALASFAYFFFHDMDGVYFGLVSAVLLGIGIPILGARSRRLSEITIAGKDLEIQRLAKLAERERIARDLHDLLGHTLSLIAIKSDLARKLAVRDGPAAAAEMAEVAAIARKALAEVREAILGMLHLGLRDALGAADALLRAAGLDTTTHWDTVPSLPVAEEKALAQMVLEAATNIVRHAQASHATIRVSCDAAECSVCVEDDGCGGPILRGQGLTGMAERLNAVGGRLDLESLQPGTRLTAFLPLPSSEAPGHFDGPAAGAPAGLTPTVTLARASNP